MFVSSSSGRKNVDFWPACRLMDKLVSADRQTPATDLAIEQRMIVTVILETFLGASLW